MCSWEATHCVHNSKDLTTKGRVSLFLNVALLHAQLHISIQWVANIFLVVNLLHIPSVSLKELHYNGPTESEDNVMRKHTVSTYVVVGFLIFMFLTRVGKTAHLQEI